MLNFQLLCFEVVEILTSENEQEILELYEQEREKIVQVTKKHTKEITRLLDSLKEEEQKKVSEQ